MTYLALFLSQWPNSTGGYDLSVLMLLFWTGIGLGAGYWLERSGSKRAGKK